MNLDDFKKQVEEFNDIKAELLGREPSQEHQYKLYTDEVEELLFEIRKHINEVLPTGAELYDAPKPHDELIKEAVDVAFTLAPIAEYVESSGELLDVVAITYVISIFDNEEPLIAATVESNLSKYVYPSSGNKFTGDEMEAFTRHSETFDKSRYPHIIFYVASYEGKQVGGWFCGDKLLKGINYRSPGEIMEAVA